MKYYVNVTKLNNTYWYKDTDMKVLHREDGPAVEYSDGTKEWWVNGKPHRTDGPAVEFHDGHKEWWLNGSPHREDGPAVEGSKGYNAWYINGKQLTKAEFNAATSPVAELTVADIEKLFGKKFSEVLCDIIAAYAKRK